MKLSDNALRLYAVTDRSVLNGQSLYEAVEEALEGGVTLVQLREKELDNAAFLKEAIELTRLCHRYGVPLVVNDRLDVAMQSGADGVHLGQDDLPAAEARALLGPDMIVGVTAKTVEQARLAEAAGADYLGSGAVFGSSTKLNARPMSMDTLRSITQAVSIPVAAIGGINRNNILQLAGTGIAGAAVVSGLFAAEDVRQEGRLLRRLIEQVCGQ